MLTYRLIYALLDDEHGISCEAYDSLINWLACHKDGSLELAERISARAKSSDGRFYVPEGTAGNLLSLGFPDGLEVK